MEKLAKSELLYLLNNNSQKVLNSKMREAYERLVKQIQSIESDNSYSTIYRILNLTRVEFESLQSYFQCEQGKKCP